MLFVTAACPAAYAADPPAPEPAERVDTVVVSGDKLKVETQIDRKVYSVAPDIQSTFGSLSDVLSAIPSIDVDQDGIVSLRGDTNVLILIDGKPSTQLSGTAAGDNLQSIAAKDIERIEVLTTPPPQYKADGAAGVINIITRKKHPRGGAGSAQASVGSAGRTVLGADGSWSSERFTAAATAGYRYDIRERVQQLAVTAPLTDPVVSTNTIRETIHRAVPEVGLSAQYALSDRQSVSGSANWSSRGGLRTYSELDYSNPPSGSLTSSTQRLSTGHDPQVNYDGKLGFSQKFDRPDETLDFSLHRSSSHQREHYDYTNESFIPPASTFFNNLNYDEEQATTDVGVDYALPLSKASTLKLGYALSEDDFRFRSNGNNVDSGGAQTPDLLFNHDFKFSQYINAAYVSFQRRSGNWNWLGGLRAELTRIDARLLTGNTTNTSSYSSVFPSLHVDRVLSDESTVSFGASRRVTRPDPESFDPYVDYEYSPNLYSGNPILKPQYTQSYEVGYQYEGRLSGTVTGYYRLNHDSVTILDEYLGNGLSLSTKANLPKDDSAGLEFTLAGSLVNKLSYSVSGNLFYAQIDATALGMPGLQSTIGINAKVKLDYRPTVADTVQLTVTRTDKRLTAQGFIAATNIVNLGYKHQLLADLTAVLTLANAFNGHRYRRFESTPTFTEEYQRTVLDRIVFVGVVYSFGSGKKAKQSNFDYDPTG